MYQVKESSTAEQLKNIIALRYEILRKPWDQPAETATDDLEHISTNAFITDKDENVIACGRLQENENKVGQVRYMAVNNLYQGKGLGKLILKFLEEKAKEKKLVTIELQARENAVKFYQNNGYSIQEKSFLLWGIIQHYRMVKTL